MKRAAANLTVEQRLLAACVCPDEEKLGAALRACLDGGDWAAFVRGAVRHGVAQVAADRLSRRAEWDALPDLIRLALDRTVHANRRRNDVLFAELGRAVCALDAAIIPTLLLKGPALALTVYPDPALRHFGDLDLLVHEADFERAGAALEACGFTAERGPEPGSHERTYVRCIEEDILTGALAPQLDPATRAEAVANIAGRRVVIELHRGLFRDASARMRRLDLSPFWSGARVICLPDGTAARVPPPEPSLIYLCAHAADHGFGRLMHLLDLALALRAWGDGLNWAEVEALAVRNGVTRATWRALEVVCRELHANVPQSLLDRLRAGCPGVRPLSLAYVFATQELPRGGATLRRWRESEDRAERMAGLLHLVLPVPAAMRRLYGAPLPAPLPLLYLWRPLQLAGRAARAVAGPVLSRTTCRRNV